MRPKTLEHVFVIRLSKSHRDKLAKIAKRWGVSQSEVLRIAIDKYTLPKVA